jgi:DNA-binding MarR family transcriptional regulator
MGDRPAITGGRASVRRTARLASRANRLDWNRSRANIFPHLLHPPKDEVVSGRTPHGDAPHTEIEGIDPGYQGVVQALMRTMQLQRQLMQKLLAESVGGTDTHPGQAMCLRALGAHDGITQRDLAEMLHVSRPTVTTMLQRLERSGWIERRVDPDDQRLTHVHLTAGGSALESQLRVVFAEYVRRTFGHLTEAERQELERLLHTLSGHAVRALHDAPAPAVPEPPTPRSPIP